MPALMGIFQNFISRKFVSIRIKFMVSMTVTILLFGTINLIISRTIVLDAVREQVRQKNTLLQEGRLEIEINEALAAEKAKSVEVAMSAMIAAFLVLGMGGAMVFSHYISDPIYKILKAFREFEPGGSMPKFESPWNDEMRLLSQGFQSMMERINETDRNFKQAQAKILETERLASMGTLATGLAHEINNPIAGIQMCLLRLQKSSRLDTRQSDYLSLISEATNHIKGVVSDLINYAQNSDRENYPVDLRTVIAEAAKLTQPRLNRNQIQLHLHLPEEPCVVSGVKPHLIQVLVNGLINAIDAIHRDGNIWISLNRQNGTFRIAIEDDGTGIAAETASKAFEPFFTTKGKKGTGLGLYVSFGIVKAHQGSLELMERTEGKGAVLAVTLPAESTDEYSHRRG